MAALHAGHPAPGAPQQDAAAVALVAVRPGLEVPPRPGLGLRLHGQRVAGQGAPGAGRRAHAVVCAGRRHRGLGRRGAVLRGLGARGAGGRAPRAAAHLPRERRLGAAVRVPGHGGPGLPLPQTQQRAAVQDGIHQVPPRPQSGPQQTVFTFTDTAPSHAWLVEFSCSE